MTKRKNRQTRGQINESSAHKLPELNITRRGLFGVGALMGLAALGLPAKEALAWSSWTNATSEVLKKIGMGDCVHEDLVQIAYARMLRNHANDASKPDSLLNPWGGAIQADARYAKVAGDTVDAGDGAKFADANDLAARLFRENLAYLRIGSFWNDAAANTLADFGYSCFYAKSIPTFSGKDYYEGAWDVAQHIWETDKQNRTHTIKGLDALVQFTMNDRNNFIHGLLSSTASRSGHLKQSEVKLYALQWLGVAYEYARTGKVTSTSDVNQEQAEKIFKGFIDTYGQLDENAHDMCTSLKVGPSEASIRIPHRRLRLRALGMVCHTLEDFWCPSHTCRTYRSGNGIPQNAVLAFGNYELQNGTKPPMFGYHIPFDRYAVSDATNSTNWREALTRGAGSYKGTETLANVLDSGMSCLSDAHTYFNTLGMNESIATVTRLFEFMFQNTPWDSGVRAWVDTEILPTYFDSNGQSYICDAGRRCLHTPTYIIEPLKPLKRAYSKAGLSANYDEAIAAAKDYDAWQRGTHSFFSGKYNTTKSKFVTSGFEGNKIWDDKEGENRLVKLANALYAGYGSLDASKRTELLTSIGLNGCHSMLTALTRVRGMLQEFAIELTGSLRPASDDTIKKLEELRTFFESGVKGQKPVAAQALGTAADDEGVFVTARMAVENRVNFEDGSYLIAVRDMDSLTTSIMSVPTHTPGKDRLEAGKASLTITYTIQEAFEDDPDFIYVVTSIDYDDAEEDTFYITGVVQSVDEDKKELTLDFYDLDKFVLGLGKLTNVPRAGQFICARYSPNMTLVDYEELYTPGELHKVTYPVESVSGTRVWLATNSTSAEDGYLNELMIEYGEADVLHMPIEGQEITVYYHDEYYGDVDNVDEGALVAASFAEDPTRVLTQDGEFDSAEPGYLDFGDKYGELSYGNEVFHVANIIGDSDHIPAPVQKDGWQQLESGDWSFVQGGERTSGWMCDERGYWYHFDEDGVMSTNWFQDADGSWYFCRPEHDGHFGALRSGWVLNGGYWYYLNEKHDGHFGRMLTGWQKIEGSWYYLRENSGGPLGSCLLDGITPDGYRVDVSGRWIG